MTSHRKQTGFTMIELIVVIVILGILAATALPKFIDLRSDAVASAANGMAGNLASAMSVNYAACSAVNHATTGVGAGKCTKVSDCTDGAKLLQGALTSPFTVSGTTFTITSQALATNGATATCVLVGSNGSTTTPNINFQGIGAGN